MAAGVLISGRSESAIILKAAAGKAPQDAKASCGAFPVAATRLKRQRRLKGFVSRLPSFPVIKLRNCCYSVEKCHKFHGKKFYIVLKATFKCGNLLLFQKSSKMTETGERR